MEWEAGDNVTVYYCRAWVVRSFYWGIVTQRDEDLQLVYLVPEQVQPVLDQGIPARVEVWDKAKGRGR